LRGEAERPLAEAKALVIDEVNQREIEREREGGREGGTIHLPKMIKRLWLSKPVRESEISHKTFSLIHYFS